MAQQAMCFSADPLQVKTARIDPLSFSIGGSSRTKGGHSEVALGLVRQVEERGDLPSLVSELDRKVHKSFDLERRSGEIALISELWQQPSTHNSRH